MVALEQELGLGAGRAGGRDYKRASGTFWGDGCVCCLDCGDGFTGVYTHQTLSNSTL